MTNPRPTLARTVPSTGLVALALLAWTPQASADGSAVPTVATTVVGTWQGGGRACAGTLNIQPRTLSWRTPFNRCVGLPFKVTDLGEKDGTGRTLFTLQRTAPSCPFASIELQRKALATGPAGPAGQAAWEVIGHPSEADRLAGRLDQALACPVVRLK